MSEQGRPLPKFGEWDVNDPASAEGFTVIFNKARDEKKTGGKPESSEKGDPHNKPGAGPAKSQSVSISNELILDMFSKGLYGNLSFSLLTYHRENGSVVFKPREWNLDEPPCRHKSFH